MTSFKLTREQIAQPAFEEGRNSAEEKEPDSPSGRPNAASGALTDRSSVESVINQVLQILAHANLPHQLVLVAVHARQLADVGENVLQSIRQLEGIDVVQTVLDVRVNDELRQTQDFSTQVESVTETRLFTLFCRQSFHGFQVEVVIQMQVVEIFTMDQ